MAEDEDEDVLWLHCNAGFLNLIFLDCVYFTCCAVFISSLLPKFLRAYEEFLRDQGRFVGAWEVFIMPEIYMYDKINITQLLFRFSPIAGS